MNKQTAEQLNPGIATLEALEVVRKKKVGVTHIKLLLTSSDTSLGKKGLLVPVSYSVLPSNHRLSRKTSLSVHPKWPSASISFYEIHQFEVPCLLSPASQACKGHPVEIRLLLHNSLQQKFPKLTLFVSYNSKGCWYYHLSPSTHLRVHHNLWQAYKYPN